MSTVFGSLQSDQKTYYSESRGFYGAGSWSPEPSVTPEQASALAKQGGGTIITGNQVWNVKPSQEFYTKEVSKAVGEEVTPTGQKGIQGNQITSEVFVGKTSGKVYEYNPSTSVLTGYGVVGGDQLGGRLQVNAGGYPITFSEGVTSKVGGEAGFRNLWTDYQFQSVINQGMYNAQHGGADVMYTPEEMNMINSRNQANDFMLFERATRPEYLLSQTFLDWFGQSTKGYAGMLALASGAKIEDIRATELSMRKADVSATLANPFIVVEKEAGLGLTLFGITGGRLITATNFGKVFQVGVGGYTVYRGAELTGQTLNEINLKGLNFETGGKLAIGVIGMTVGAGLVRSGLKQPTVWSDVKQDVSTVKFEGSSKTITVGSLDYKQNVARGVSIAEVNTHGTRTSWFGMAKQDIYERSFPSTIFSSKLTEGFGMSDTWSPSIVNVQTKLFGRVTGNAVSYPTSWSETSFISEHVSSLSQGSTLTTGKTFQDYLKNMNVLEVRGELPEGTMGRTNINEKWIKLDTLRMEQAIDTDVRSGGKTDFSYGYKSTGELKTFILKHEVIHNLLPNQAKDIDAGYSMGARSFVENFNFAKAGKISLAGQSSSNQIKVIGTTESFGFEGTKIFYQGISGSISTVDIISSVSKPLKNTAEDNYFTNKQGYKVFISSSSSKDSGLMLTARKSVV